VEDLTDPTLCKDYFGASDADLAALYGGPVDTDWFGHGTWIGGNIAAALDGVGVNGIAPDVKLVSLKIAEWCGYAYDSSILDAFYYAADHGIDIVSISFGGYLDRTDPDQEAVYQAYVDAVRYAARKGTVIVAAAGNEHLRIGAGGQVLSHGPLTTPGATFGDYYGLWATPGGIPGIVDVSATGNVVNAASATCAPGTFESSEATCKPKSDTHQPFGVGRQNQLTYYSNYGPRIDVAAPGGARKFNVPSADRGGTGGFPNVKTEGYKAWEDFSITSNWAQEIPCYYNVGPEFYPDECYSTIQGTSMATPHASAVLALIASSNKVARHHPAMLVGIMKLGAEKIRGNMMPPLSATDTSAGDRTGKPCLTGYCHLGGSPIPDWEAYGAGLVNALAATFGGH
jgi:subtilisin family serine protease